MTFINDESGQGALEYILRFGGVNRSRNNSRINLQSLLQKIFPFQTLKPVNLVIIRLKTSRLWTFVS